MEHKDHKELWDRINAMQSHINICEVERARMQKDVEDLRRKNGAAAAWSMKVLGIAVIFIMSIGGAGINMYSTQESQQIQIERLEGDVTKSLDFVAKWPTGQLGSLPDDNVQNTKIEFLEKNVEEQQSQLNKLFNIITDDFKLNKIE